MADLNYVSPLTSDLTDYYTKTEVDELQQGDENRFATQAQITAGDNEVKGWVSSQGYLTQHQSLQNYATKEYVDDAIESIDIDGGMKVRVVNVLPAEGEEGIFYLVYESNDDEENRYAEYIWSDTLNGYEMLGYGTGEGVLPDLTNYATKQWVEAKGYLDSSDLIGYATISDLADFATKDYVDDELANKADSATLAAVATSGDYDDLINKPTIPSLTGYATTTYVDDAVGAVVVPSDAEDIAFDNTSTGLQATNVQTAIDELTDNTFAEFNEKANISDLATVATSGSYNDLTDKPVIPAAPDLSSYATKSELSAKANAADLATVATSGSYNDLSNKPTIPSTSGLASETYVDNAIAAIKGSEIDNDMNWVDEPMVKGFVYDEIQNNVSAAGLSGDYDDLTNKPTIPTVPTNVSSFTNDAGYLTSHQDISGKANIADLATVATSGDYDDLTNKPTIPSISGLATETYVDNAVAGISVPANTSDLTNDSGFITSSDLPDTSGFVESSDLATVATTGDYDDLTNKPTIPVLPTLATVATSGSYNDLTDRPTIPVVDNKGFGDGFFKLFAKNWIGSSYVYQQPANTTDATNFLNQGDIIVPYTDIDIYKNSLTDMPFCYGYYIANDGTYTQKNINPSLTIRPANAYVKVGQNVVVYWPIDTTKTDDDKVRHNILTALTHILPYSNTTSGLIATTIQAAIDELAAASGSSSGITVQDVLDAVANDEFEASDEYGNTVYLNPSNIGYTNEAENNGETTQIFGNLGANDLLFSKSVDDGNEIVENSLDITPNFDDGVLQVEIDGNETKTIAFVEDLPSAVSYSYNSSTGYMTFTGFDER